MSKKKNFYQDKAKQKSLLGLGSAAASHLPSREKITASLAITGRDILLGGIGGALGGALVGRGAFLLGLGITGVANVMGSSTGAVFGVGMMASGGYQTINGLSGVEKDGLEGVKERFQNFQSNLKRQLFLDKILPKKKAAATTEETTNGMGEVQYFNHADEVSGLDYTEANRIEEQIRESGRQFEARAVGEISGTDDEMQGVEGVDGTDGIEGIEDRLI